MSEYCCGILEDVVLNADEDIIQTFDEGMLLVYQQDKYRGNFLVKQLHYCPFCGEAIK